MSKVPSKSEIRQQLRRAKRRGKGEQTDVPGPTENPATNLMMADIAMRMGSYIMRNLIERAFLRGRYGKGTAKEIVRGRSIGQTLASVAIAKVGTRSLPGAAAVTAGLAGKVLLDRSRARSERHEKKQGDSELLERASDD